MEGGCCFRVLRRSRVNLRSVSAVATCALLAGAFVLPSSYVKEGPGPLFDVLGTYQEKDVIEVSWRPAIRRSAR